jgi:hypothetical protein
MLKCTWVQPRGLLLELNFKGKHEEVHFNHRIYLQL